jgi:hypothetical protein
MRRVTLLRRAGTKDDKQAFNEDGPRISSATRRFAAYRAASGERHPRPLFPDPRLEAYPGLTTVALADLPVESIDVTPPRHDIRRTALPWSKI